MKKALIIAALLLAAIAPLSAQEWHQVNDTTWRRDFVRSDGVITDYAYAVDPVSWATQINNDLHNAALLQYAMMGTAALAAIDMMLYAMRPSSARLMAGIALGAASIGCYAASVAQLHQKRVYVSPEGVIIRIGRTERPKYDNKKKFTYPNR